MALLRATRADIEGEKIMEPLEQRTLLSATVELDASGNLLITEDAAIGDNILKIEGDAATGAFVISTPTAGDFFVIGPILAMVGSVTGGGTTSVTVPASTFTGQINFSTLGGNDSLTVDLTSAFSKPLSFDGGSGSDELQLPMVATPFTTITHTFNVSGPNSIELVRPMSTSTISYFDLESNAGMPAVNDRLTVDSRIFNFSTANEMITLSNPVNSDLRLDDGVNRSVEFTNPAALLTINGGSGNDTININAVDNAFRASLTINGNEGDDTVELNANISFANDKSLDVDLTNDATSGSDDIFVGNGALIVMQGNGKIDLQASRRIVLNQGSRLETAAGELKLAANQGTTVFTPGDFIGVQLLGATVTSAGGSIEIRGRGGDAAGGMQVGISLESVGGVPGVPSMIIGNGLLTIDGKGGLSDGNQNVGLRLSGGSNVNRIGDVTVSGSGGGQNVSEGNFGVWLHPTGGVIRGNTVSVAGFGGTSIGAANHAIVWEGLGSDIAANLGGTVMLQGNLTSSSPGSFAIAVHRDNLVFDPMTTTWNAGTMGAVLIRPQTNTTPIDVGGNDIVMAPRTLGLSDAELHRITADRLVIGDPNTGAITVSAAVSTLNSHLNLTSGVGIEIQNSLTLADHRDFFANVMVPNGPLQFTTANADVSLSGSGRANLIAPNFEMVTGSSLVTAGGEITLSVDSANLSGMINSGVGPTSVFGVTPGRPIDLGQMPGVAGELELSDAEFDTISAGLINLGTVNGGPLTISDAITHSSPELFLQAGANSITFSNGGSLNANGGAGNVRLLTDFAGTGAIIGHASTTNIIANLLSLGAGSGGIGDGTTPLSFDANSLRTMTGGDGSQFLREAGTVEVFAGTVDIPGGLSAGTGTIRFAGGTFTLGGSNLINNEADVAITSGAIFGLGTNNETIDQLILLDGSVTGVGTLSVGSPFDLRKGSIRVNLAAAGTTLVGVSKSTPDIVTLSGPNNSYTGPTTLLDGTLALVSTTSNNSIPNSARITLTSGATLDVTGLDVGTTSDTLILASGQTLNGIGSINGKLIAQDMSVVSPGNSPGVISSGSVNLQAGSTLNIEVNGNMPGSGAANHDQLNVTGSVMLGGATLNLSGSISSVAGQQIVIVNNDDIDPVMGQFVDGGGTTLNEGATVTINGVDFILSYAGGAGGNDVTLTQAGGTLMFDDNDGAADAWTIRRVGGNVRVLNGLNIIDARPIAAGAAVQILGEDNQNDTLTLDFSGGNPFAVPTLVYSGGNGGNDSLAMTGVGTQFGLHTYNHTNANDGSVVLNNGANFTVNYTGLEPISNDGTATNVVFNLTTAANNAVFEDQGAPADGLVRLTNSGAATFETTVFANPTISLTINTNDGNDSVTINTLDAGFRASLVINGQSGNDSIVVSAPLQLGSGTSSGNLNLSAEMIDLSADIMADGTVTLGSGASDSLTVSAAAVVTTTDDAVTLNATTAGNEDFTINAGGGIAFNAPVTMSAGKDLSATSTSTAAGITLPNGNSDLVASGLGTITLSAARNITLSSGSSVMSAGGTITLTANQGTTVTSGNYIGIDVGGTVSTTSGNLNVMGRAGDAIDNFKIGVFVGSGGSLTTVSGSVTVNGTGGTGGRSFAHGVQVNNGGQIVATGNGMITVTGTGGANSRSSDGVLVSQSGARIESTSGNVQVNGQGGGSTDSRESNGVQVRDTGIITAGGTVTIVGTGGSANTVVNDNGFNHGVYLGTNGQITAGGGLSVTGTGGTTLGNGESFGVALEGPNNLLSAGGTATTTINGTGGGGGGVGVLVRGANSRITSAGGTVDVTGTGRGVQVDQGGQITSGGNGQVMVTGTGGVAVASAAQITSGGSGSVTVTGIASATVPHEGVSVDNANSLITSGGGLLTVTGTGSGGANANSFASGVVVLNGGQILSPGNTTLTVMGTGGANSSNSAHGVLVSGTNSQIASAGGNVAITGLGGGTTSSLNNHGVQVRSGGVITAAGTVTIVGTGGAGNTVANGTGFDHGVYLGGNGQITAGSSLSVTGTGGNTLGNGESFGVALEGSNNLLSAGGTATTTIIGTGGVTSGSVGVGVLVRGTNSRITSAGGTVDVTGTGRGVQLDQSGQVTSGGNGQVVVTGTGGVSVGSAAEITSGGNGSVSVTGLASATVFHRGVTVQDVNSRITSGGGSVTVTGTASGGANADSFATGVMVQNGAQILSPGTTPLTVMGTGGTNSSNSAGGVAVFGMNARIESLGGNVVITGVAGGSISARENHGVQVGEGAITAAGTVTITGTGGSASTVVSDNGFDHGVYLNGAGEITAGGSLSITGTGGTTSGNGESFGVGLLGSNNLLSSGGTAATTITGTGGVTSGSDGRGVSVEGNNTRITSAGGMVDVTETGAGLNVANGGSITTANSNAAIALTANAMFLADVVTAGTGTVTLRQRTAGTAINLGSTNNPSGGPLSLSNDELDFVTAGTLNIGDANSGSIAITAAMSPGSTTVLSLQTGAAIIDGNTSGADLTVTSLVLSAATGIGGGDAIETSVTNLEAANSAGGGVSIVNSGALTIGGLSAANGVSSADGGINLSVSGLLTVNEAIAATSSGDITIAANDINLTSTISVGGSGNGITILSADGEAMFLGGDNSGPNPGIYLTDAELAQISTPADGFITFGDNNYSANVFIKTATLATTAGATTNVVQLVGLSGARIELDDDGGTATALDGNGGTINLTAGNGGIKARNNNNSAAEIATTGSRVNLMTQGSVGSDGSSNRLQFAHNADPAQQNIFIGAGVTNAIIDGLGTLTLKSVSGSFASPTSVDVTARGDLVVPNDSTISSGSASLSLAADTNANGTGHDGGGTLSLGPAVFVNSAFAFLRGADIEINATATIGSAVNGVGIQQTNGIEIRSSVPSRPMSLGGANDAVAGINLTDGELSRLFARDGGVVRFGNSNQTGNVTFVTAKPATTAGTRTEVIQSQVGGGQILLDDESGTTTALDGNGASVTMTAGIGGINAVTAPNQIAEIGNATTVTLTSGGGIGTAQTIELGAANLSTDTSSNSSNQVFQSLAPVSVDQFNSGGGTISLPSGTFNLSANDVIADTTVVDVTGGTLSLGAFNDTVGRLILSSGSITGSGTLSSVDPFDVRSGLISANLGGLSGLNKTTTATVTLSGETNSLSGTLTVNEGTLSLAASTTNNNIPATANIAVAAGAFLDVTGFTTTPAGTLILASGQSLGGSGVAGSGSGSVGTVGSGGTLNGGRTVIGGAVIGSVIADAGSTIAPIREILSVNDVTLQNGSTFTVSVDGPLPGAGHGMLIVTGVVTINDSTLSLEGQIVSSPGQVIVLIDNDGLNAVVGQFVNASGMLPEGSTVTITTLAGDVDFILSYAGGAGGNDVTLTQVGATTYVGDGSGAGSLEVRVIGSSLQFVDDGVIVDSRPLGALGGQMLTVIGTDGVNDTLTLDFGTGNVIPIGGLNYNGGAGGFDTLALTNVGTQFGTQSYDYTNGSDGSIVLRNSNGMDFTINYLGLEPLSNTGTALNLVFNLPGVSDSGITLSDLGGGMARLESATGTFERTDFAYPAEGGSLTINLGAGNQTITVTSLSLNPNTKLRINGGAGNDVINLDAANGITAGTLELLAETMAQTGRVTVTGTTSLDAGVAGTIALTQPANDFMGAVSIVAGNNVSLANNGDLDLAGATISGNLSVMAAGDISDSGAIAVTGTASFQTLGTGDIELDGDNDFGGAVSAVGSNVVLNDVTGINLGTITLSGTLLVTTNNDVAGDGPLTIGGDATFAVGAGGDLTLAGANDFQANLVINSATDVTINDVNALNLGTSNISGNLTITASGAINNNGNPIAVDGTTSLAAGVANDIGLINVNDFVGAVTIVSANNVALTDQNGINLGNLSIANNANITASGLVDFVGSGASTIGGNLQITTIIGSINDSGAGSLAVAGLTRIFAGTALIGDVTLNNAGNDFSTVLISRGRNVSLADANGIDLGSSAVTGSLMVSANGPITDSGNLTVAGNARFDAGGGAITLGDAVAEITNFGSLAFNSTSTVTISEDSATVLEGLSSADSLRLISAGAIDESVAGTSVGLAVTNNALFDAGANTISLGLAGAFRFGTLTFLTAAGVTIREADDTVLNGDSSAGGLMLTSGGSISDGTDGDLAVVGNASFTADAGNITLGNDPGNLFAVGSLTLKSSGAAFIREADNSVMIGATDVGSLTLISAGSISDLGGVGQPGVFTRVAGNASFAGTSTTLGDNPADVVMFGSVTFNSTGNVSITEDDATQLAGSNTANNLVVTSAAEITDLPNTDLVVTGQVSFIGVSVTLGDDPADVQTYGTISFVVDPQVVTLAQGDAEFAFVNTALQDVYQRNADADPNNDVSEAEINALMQQLTEQVIAHLNLTDAIVILIDPVDFVVTDSAGRQAGIVGDNVQCEIPGTYYSGNGTVELLIIPLVQQGGYSMQLTGVGNGDYRIATTQAEGGNNDSQYRAGNLPAGSNLTVALEGTPLLPVKIGLGLASAQNDNVSQFTGFSLAPAPLLDYLARSNDLPNLEELDFGDSQRRGWEQWLDVIAQARSITRRLPRQVIDALGLPFGEWLEEKIEAQGEEQMTDLFWKQLGQSLGMPSKLHRLGDLLDSLVSPSQEDKGNKAQPHQAPNVPKSTRPSDPKSRNSKSRLKTPAPKQSQQPESKTPRKSAQHSAPAPKAGLSAMLESWWNWFIPPTDRTTQTAAK